MPAPRKYPDELRERAVRLYRESSPRPTFRRLGGQLNVHPEALRNWVRQADAGERDDRPTTDMLAENRRLARGNVELRRVNEVLRAASAYFASAVTTYVRRLWSCSGVAGSAPALLTFAADAGAFAALGRENVGVPGVGVAPTQVALQPAGQHGVVGVVQFEAPITKVRSGPNWACRSLVC